MSPLSYTHNQGTLRIAYEQIIFFLTASAIFLIFCLSSGTLNLFIPYSISGGHFLMKFHPATWLTALVLILLCVPRINLKPLPSYIMLALGIMGCLVAWLAINARGALASTFIDTCIVPLILILAIAQLPDHKAEALMRLFINLAALGAVIILIEYALKIHITPRGANEAYYYRPRALFGHPITAGVTMNCAMFLALRGVVPPVRARLYMLLFLAAIVCCGVRGPLAIAGLIFLFHMLKPARPRRHPMEYICDFGILLLLPLGIIFAFSSGALDRILALGLWDESSQSRVYIFRALDYLNPEQLWHGVDGYDVGNYLTQQATGGQFTENIFIAAILQSGLPAAFALAVVLIVLYVPVMRYSHLYALMVVMVMFTTLTFSTKNMGAAAMALTGYWVWRQAQKSRSLPNRPRKVGTFLSITNS